MVDCENDDAGAMRDGTGYRRIMGKARVTSSSVAGSGILRHWGRVVGWMPLAKSNLRLNIGIIDDAIIIDVGDIGQFVVQQCAAGIARLEGGKVR